MDTQGSRGPRPEGAAPKPGPPGVEVRGPTENGWVSLTPQERPQWFREPTRPRSSGAHVNQWLQGGGGAPPPGPQGARGAVNLQEPRVCWSAVGDVYWEGSPRGGRATPWGRAGEEGPAPQASPRVRASLASRARGWGRDGGGRLLHVQDPQVQGILDRTPLSLNLPPLRPHPQPRATPSPGQLPSARATPGALDGTGRAGGAGHLRSSLCLRPLAPSSAGRKRAVSARAAAPWAVPRASRAQAPRAG